METKLKTTELKEYGTKLALGIPDKAGHYHKDLAFRRWNLKMNEELKRKQRQKGKGALTFFQYVAVVLSEMCTRIGPHDFTQLEEKERLAIIYSMYYGDVMQAYVLLRYETMGEDINVNLVCPRCNGKTSFVGDLGTLPIRSADKTEDVEWEYKVRDQFEVRSENTESFLFSPIRWSSFKLLNPEKLEKMESSIVLGSIKAVNNKEVALVDGELDEMGKRDFETILNLINDNSLGPDMSIDAVCDKAICNNEWKVPIDWTYDNFFSVTSR